MAEVKMFVLLSNILGIPIAGYTIFINLGTWKADVLFILSGLFIAARLYFYVRRNVLEEKSRALKLRKEEHDILSEIEEEE